MTGKIRNKVSESALITFDLEEHYDHGLRVVFDIKDQLFQEMILKEKDFRSFIKTNDWTVFADKNVAIICSVDAIVPTWAYMLLAAALRPQARNFVFGDLVCLENYLFQKALSKINLVEFEDQKVIIKGCGNLPVPEFAYVEISKLLLPIVSSLMYGEACSAVPLFKRPKVST